MTKEREENLVARSQESYLEGNSYIFCVEEKMKLIKATQVCGAMKLLFHSPETFFPINSVMNSLSKFWMDFLLYGYLFPWVFISMFMPVPHRMQKTKRGLYAKSSRGGLVLVFPVDLEEGVEHESIQPT